MLQPLSRSGVQASQVRFTVDGEPPALHDTAEELGLEDAGVLLFSFLVPSPKGGLSCTTKLIVLKGKGTQRSHTSYF